MAGYLYHRHNKPPADLKQTKDMDSKEFYDTVKNMRIAQREYFRTRDQLMLAEAMRLERIVDKEIERVENIINNRQQ